MLIQKDIFKIAIRGLLLNKIRFALSLMGILIGIAGVVGIIVIGEGKKEKVNEFVTRMGADIVIIDYMGADPTDKNAGKPLNERDISFIKRACPSALEISEVCNVGLNYPPASEYWVGFGGGGVEPQFVKVADIEIIKGRFITQTDIQEKRRICVVEQNPTLVKQCKKKLAIGDYLGYGAERLKIVGFVKTKKIFTVEKEYQNTQLQAYCPISTAKELLTVEGIPLESNQTFYIQSLDSLKTTRLLSEVENAIKRLNAGRLPSNLKPYTYTNLVEEGLKEVKRTTLIMSAIALLALIVGGIGIMNVMYISVMERVKEIGIRMAVGADQKDILGQFLIEALLLCLGGGIIGVISGIFIAYYFTPFFDIPFVISFPPIITGLLLASVVGITAGLKPAMKASKLDPVEILR